MSSIEIELWVQGGTPGCSGEDWDSDGPGEPCMPGVWAGIWARSLQEGYLWSVSLELGLGSWAGTSFQADLFSWVRNKASSKARGLQCHSLQIRVIGRVFLCWPCNVQHWDLRSQSRAQTQGPCVGKWSLTLQTVRGGTLPSCVDSCCPGPSPEWPHHHVWGEDPESVALNSSEEPKAQPSLKRRLQISWISITQTAC